MGRQVTRRGPAEYSKFCSNLTIFGYLSPGVLPYISNIGMCRCEGYGCEVINSKIGYYKSERLGLHRVSFFTKRTSWLKVLSRLRKPGNATQKYEKVKSAKFKFTQLSLNSVDRWLSWNTTGYYNCQKSGLRRKYWTLLVTSVNSGKQLH